MWKLQCVHELTRNVRTQLVQPVVLNTYITRGKNIKLHLCLMLCAKMTHTDSKMGWSPWCKSQWGQSSKETSRAKFYGNQIRWFLTTLKKIVKETSLNFFSALREMKKTDRRSTEREKLLAALVGTASRTWSTLASQRCTATWLRSLSVVGTCRLQCVSALHSALWLPFCGMRASCFFISLSPDECLRCFPIFGSDD